MSYPLTEAYDYTKQIGYSYGDANGVTQNFYGVFSTLPSYDPNDSTFSITPTILYEPITYVQSYSSAVNTTVSADESPAQSTYKEILTTDKTLAVNPKDMHLFCQNLFIMNMGTFGDITNTLNFGEYAVPWKDSDGGFFIDNNYILWVARKFEGIKAPAHEISAEKGLRVTDPDSIYYSGVDFRNPVFYRSSSKIYIYPSITETETGFASMVKYDDKFSVDSEEIDYFPSHLLFLVVLYASIRGLKLAAGDQRKFYKEKSSSPLKVWKDLYPNDSITAEKGLSEALPLPKLPKSYKATLNGDGTVTMSSDAQKDYPDITIKGNYNWPQDGEVNSLDEIMQETWDFIKAEEEVQLATGAINRFNLMVTDFQTLLGEVNNKYANVMKRYQMELSDWQTKFNTVTSVWAQNKDSYEKEMALLNAEIQRFEAEYNSHFFPKHYQEKRKEEGSY